MCDERVKALFVRNNEESYLISKEVLREGWPLGLDLHWTSGIIEAASLAQCKRHDICVIDHGLETGRALAE
jgi:hypothetical protein